MESNENVVMVLRAFAEAEVTKAVVTAEINDEEEE